MENLSDIEIVEKVLSGENSTFEVLLDRYQNQIFAYVLRLLNFHQADAEDAAAETFSRAYINLARFNTAQKFSSWLYRIAHNIVIDRYKERNKYTNIDLDKVATTVNLDNNLASKKDLEKVLNKLAFDDRNILVLFYLEEKSIKEIASILQILPGTVKVRLHRAKNKAKEFIN